MIKKFVSIDFEYNTTSEQRLNLVCCSMYFPDTGVNDEYWVYDNPEAKAELKKCILDLRDNDYVFLAWNVVAEAQSFISLGVDPTKCKWIDDQLEYKMLTNHCHKFMYGKQLISGEEKFTYPPKNKWKQTEEERKFFNNSKPQKSLASGLYKLLGVKVDTDHKTLMRDIIISNNPVAIEANKTAIQDYCTSDVKYLYDAWLAIKKAYRKNLDPKYMVTFDEVLYRGESAARTALMMSTGYPINYEKTKNLANSIPEINKEMCEEINSQFDKPLFKWNNKEQRYSKQIKQWKKVISESEYASKWTKTAKGDFSCSLDAFEKHFSYRHDFPEGNFFAQIMRYLKTQRSFNGFLPKSKTAKNKETFFDSVGSDDRVRCWLNPYGAQSARFQPKATGFIPLKSAWVRSLIEPPKGRAICAIDYGSQEFLLAGLISGDDNMIKAYESGDVYLYFAKLAGAVPQDGTREEYETERNLFKSTTLGISYNMGAVGLSNKLTQDTGRLYTEEQAQNLINKFEKAYPKYATWIDDLRFTYYEHSHCIKLPDGWVMFGDNDNKRSVSNVPIQGFGSCILRKAIELAQKAGLSVIYPLHDALYIEYWSHEMNAIDLLKQSMTNAFVYYFDDAMKEKASIVRLDANAWSLDYTDDYVKTPSGLVVKTQKVYVDDRSKREYERFKKYL